MCRFFCCFKPRVRDVELTSINIESKQINREFSSYMIAKINMFSLQGNKKETVFMSRIYKKFSKKESISADEFTHLKQIITEKEMEKFQFVFMEMIRASDKLSREEMEACMAFDMSDM